MDDLQQDINLGNIDTSTSESLKQFSEYTTITDNELQTTVDIEKGGYLSPNGKYKFAFQTDNNVVIYETGGSAVWATGTTHSSDSFLRLEPDGNLIVSRLGETVWESGTTGEDDIWC